MKKVIFTLTAVCFFTTLTKAQLKVGDNPTTINANSVLEMESTNKGMLLPRVALSATTSFAPLAAHVAGMVVYNTATAGDVTPGYYFNNGTVWSKIVDLKTIVQGAVRDSITKIVLANEPWFNVATGTAATTNSQNIYSSGNVGIGTGANPIVSAFEIVNTTTLNDEKDNINIISHGSNNSASIIQTRTRGNQAGPTNLVSGDIIGRLTFRGRSNGSNQTAAEITANYRGSGASNQGELEFSTSSVPRMLLDISGNLGIATAAPTAKLDVDGTVRFRNLSSNPNATTFLSVDGSGNITKNSTVRPVRTNYIAATGSLAATAILGDFEFRFDDINDPQMRLTFNPGVSTNIILAQTSHIPTNTFEHLAITLTFTPATFATFQDIGTGVPMVQNETRTIYLSNPNGNPTVGSTIYKVTFVRLDLPGTDYLYSIEAEQL